VVLVITFNAAVLGGSFGLFVYGGVVLRCVVFGGVMVVCGVVVTLMLCCFCASAFRDS